MRVAALILFQLSGIPSVLESKFGALLLRMLLRSLRQILQEAAVTGWGEA